MSLGRLKKNGSIQPSTAPSCQTATSTTKTRICNAVTSDRRGLALVVATLALSSIGRDILIENLALAPGGPRRGGRPRSGDRARRRQDPGGSRQRRAAAPGR